MTRISHGGSASRVTGKNENCLAERGLLILRCNLTVSAMAPANAVVPSQSNNLVSQHSRAAQQRQHDARGYLEKAQVDQFKAHALGDYDFEDSPPQRWSIWGALWFKDWEVESGYREYHGTAH
jgi:hypothetical protein